MRALTEKNLLKGTMSMMRAKGLESELELQLELERLGGGGEIIYRNSVV